MLLNDFSNARYAIYFAPAASTPLWHFGCAVLGYDAADARDVPPWIPVGWDAAAWSEATAEPRRYGFHATLKAPMRLRDDSEEATLIAALETTAKSLEPVRLGACQIGAIGRFIALVPSAPPTSLYVLESELVETFDRFRAPMQDAERARRTERPLSARQTLYLDRYGYPFVKEEFRFHMTLTGPIADDVRASVRERITAAYEQMVAERTVAIDRLALFKQDDSNKRFRIIASAPFGA